MVNKFRLNSGRFAPVSTLHDTPYTMNYFIRWTAAVLKTKTGRIGECVRLIGKAYRFMRRCFILDR